MATLAQRTFSGGEITPSLYARVDTQKYASGLRTCRNFFVMRHGGASNRPGTKFIGEVSDSTKSTRIIPFVFNNDQTYIIEVGDQYMRFIRNDAYLSDSTATITGITQANPGVVTTSAAHGFANGDEVLIYSVSGMTELNNRNFKIANVTATTFELQDMTGTNFDTSSLTAYSSGGFADHIYEITTPYVEADLFELKFVQSADIITIAHPSYAPRELARTGHTNWTLSTITFAPGQASPTGVGISGSAGSNSYTYHVTAVNDEDFEESLAATATQGSLAAAAVGAEHTVTWTAAADAGEYNIYLEVNGVPGYVGTAIGTTFVYDGVLSPDTSDTPPTARNPFNASGDYPAIVTYFQQRLCFGNTDNNPEKVWTSRSGYFKNFTVSSPLQDDDAVTFTMSGRRVNQIRNMLDLNSLVIMTTGGEWEARGDESGILKPTAINLRQHSYNGSAILDPLVIGSNALYIQERGGIIRDLGFDFQSDGYRGADLTIFSAHLIDGFTIVDWTYQQIPHSIVWAVRSDGVLLGLTFVREQEMLAWHRHDFEGGTVKSIATIPSGDEDAPYVIVERTVNGRTVKYVEKLTINRVDDIEDSTFLDSHLSFDGRNTAATTMALTTGAGWTYLDDLTLTSSVAEFASTDVGNAYRLEVKNAAGEVTDLVRCTITAFTSTTVVTVRPHKDVPASLQSTATTNWVRMVDQLSGLWHLEGEDVSVFADGFVAASPKNDSYETVTVTNGIVTLDQPYGVIHVGLPYVSDLETLDIDTAESEPLVGKKKKISKLNIFVEESRGIWAGANPPSDDDTDPLENLKELKIRQNEDYDDPVALSTGVVDINITPEWNSNGRVFIRQIDPLPLSVLAVAPEGQFPFLGGR